MFRTPTSLFRVLAIAEAVSWTLLITALIVRAASGFALGVTIAGAIHGFVFLSYGATAVLLALHQRWTAWPTVAAIASAVIPYATIPTEIWLARSGRLAGQWRLEEAADPADRRWYDGLLRWFLRRPWVLGLLILVAVAALFTVLLLLGPPGGK
jgi:integral membrane protein